MLRTKIMLAETQVADLESGRIRAVLSTETPDRQGDIIRQDGWDLADFLKHPVMLASHDYYRLTAQIGEWEDLAVRGKQLEGVAHYYINDGNEDADWGFKLAARGKAAYSVGFIPTEYKIIKGGSEWSGPYEYLQQQMLETSHVVIPANAEALQLMAKAKGLHPEIDTLVRDLLAEEPIVKAGRVMSQANLNKLHQTMDMMSDIHDGVCDMGDDCPMGKALSVTHVKVAVASHNTGKAPEDEAWSAPTLGDFTDKTWGDLTDSERRRIVSHYVWSDNMPPEAFGDLKGPHHRAGKSGIGVAVWRAVSSGRMAQMSEFDDAGVKAHLAAHYKQFDKVPPWESDGRGYDGSETMAAIAAAIREVIG